MDLAEELGFRSNYVTVNSVRLHVVENGVGPMVLLLHGWPEFWYSWRHMIKGLGENYRAVAPDMRGYNLSEKPSGYRSYALDILVKDMIALIDYYGEGPVHLVGHDWGGIVAWQLAIQHPERFRDVVILNCPHPEDFRRALKSDFRQRLRSWYMLFFQIPYIPDLVLAALLPLVFRRAFQGWARQPEAFSDEDIQRYVAAYRRPGAITASLNYYRALFKIGPPRTDRFRMPIPIPILVLWGMDDRALGHAMTEGMNRYAGAGYKQVDIPNCSHWIQHEFPERILQETKEFWATNEKR